MTWTKVALVLVGSAVGGFGLGCLLAAVIGRRLWDTVAA